ncbi:MAG: hypothetical protein EBQ67_00030, partial [Sphingobacteriia bacterium]|nr:hypothetical protein [Sphingobacteriia bacterium]
MRTANQGWIRGFGNLTHRLWRVLLRGVQAFALLVMLVLFVAVGFYLRSEIYQFAPAQPFSGSSLYNPYDSMPPLRFKANFHAHSRSWGGLTNGHQSDSALITAYLSRGYHLPSLSNYHQISDWSLNKAPLYVPVYESGYNPLKSHLLVMGLDRPSYFDFPLYQNTSQQQQIIQGLRDRGAVLVMAHPDFGGGRRLADMPLLGGYHFMEVFNHYRHSEKYYDAALSAGRLSWVMANDDTHDLHREATFKRWNVLMGDQAETRDVMQQALMGRHYAVYAEDSSFDKALVTCTAPSENQRVFRFSHPLERIQAIGQNGKVLASSQNT